VVTRRDKLELIELKTFDENETSKYQMLTEEGKSHREAVNVIIADRLESNQ
jgi:hypothetical protein